MTKGMTDEQKKNYERYWREREYRRELHKKHPDLAELFTIRNYISSLQDEFQEVLDEHPDDNMIYDKWRDDIEDDVEMLGKVYHHLDKELKELFAKYEKKNMTNAEKFKEIFGFKPCHQQECETCPCVYWNEVNRVYHCKENIFWESTYEPKSEVGGREE